MSEMEREPWTNGESGSGAIHDQEPQIGPGNERKRTRSSSGDSNRSGDGATALQKKAKVTVKMS